MSSVVKELTQDSSSHFLVSQWQLPERGWWIVVACAFVCVHVHGREGGGGGRTGGEKEGIDMSSYFVLTPPGSIDRSQTVEANDVCHLFWREGPIRQLPSRHSA